MQQELTVIAGVLFLLGFFPYIYGIVQKKVKPTMASWIVWTTVDYICLFSMLSEHNVNGQIVGACIGATTVLLLCIRYGKGGWNMLEICCLIASVIGVVLWQLTDEPTVGIVISSIINLTASVPKFASAYQAPEREKSIGWVFGFVSCVITLLAMPSFSLANASQPVAFTITQAVMLYLLWGRARQKPS